MTPAQCRMARAALNITIADLSERANVAPNTISRFEAGKTVPIPATLAVLKNALEAAGVEFIAENGGGAGVRLWKVAE
ncbi:MAG: helix-turn-helix transcriptional regulator [Alphaproteobacteria bacterium]|nr:helix-turn-helix transcriptional regulator [Alphaproteobacteria bacterium]